MSTKRTHWWIVIFVENGIGMGGQFNARQSARDWASDEGLLAPTYKVIKVVPA